MHRNLAAWTAAIALGIAIGGCAESRGPLEPSSTGPIAGSQDIQGLGPELAAVRAATARFHDSDVAEAAGYEFVGEPCVASPAGTMGVHAPNPALIGNQTLDPEQPEALLYLPKPGGGLRLTGVEYIQPVLLRNTATGQVGPWFDPGPWPATYVVVTSTPQLFGQTFQGPMPGHNPSMPWHWDLHVWVWANNPAGMFAQWNPALACD